MTPSWNDSSLRLYVQRLLDMDPIVKAQISPMRSYTASEPPYHSTNVLFWLVNLYAFFHTSPSLTELEGIEVPEEWGRIWMGVDSIAREHIILPSIPRALWDADIFPSSAPSLSPDLRSHSAPKKLHLPSFDAISEVASMVRSATTIVAALSSRRYPIPTVEQILTRTVEVVRVCAERERWTLEGQSLAPENDSLRLTTASASLGFAPEITTSLGKAPRSTGDAETIVLEGMELDIGGGDDSIGRPVLTSTVDLPVTPSLPTLPSHHNNPGHRSESPSSPTLPHGRVAGGGPSAASCLAPRSPPPNQPCPAPPRRQRLRSQSASVEPSTQAKTPPPPFVIVPPKLHSKRPSDPFTQEATPIATPTELEGDDRCDYCRKKAIPTCIFTPDPPHGRPVESCTACRRRKAPCLHKRKKMRGGSEDRDITGNNGRPRSTSAAASKSQAQSKILEETPEKDEEQESDADENGEDEGDVLAKEIALVGSDGE